MRYIRTKDGCILEKGNVLHNISKAYGVKDIKEADTIEELCDEFVIKDVNEKYAYIREERPDILYQNCEIYGAIWTDKGLIYVAKMNEEGELELL